MRKSVKAFKENYFALVEIAPNFSHRKKKVRETIFATFLPPFTNFLNMIQCLPSFMHAKLSLDANEKLSSHVPVKRRLCDVRKGGNLHHHHRPCVKLIFENFPKLKQFFIPWRNLLMLGRLNSVWVTMREVMDM